MYLDWTYMLIVLPAFIFSLWASARVKSTFRKYEQQFSARHITGHDAARRILNQNGLTQVRIERIAGHLTDHYDPRQQVIRLSDSVYSSTSTAAIGVAAHEAGHAVQYAEEYGPIKLRQAIIPVTNIGSKLAFPLFFIGLILASVDYLYLWVAYAGLACFLLCVLFQIFTLPTEFDASKRALRALESGGILSDDELVGSKKVLWAAAMTYVAALAVSLAQVFRLLLILMSHQRRR